MQEDTLNVLTTINIQRHKCPQLPSLFLSSKLARVCALPRLAVRAAPTLAACGNLGISTQARLSQRPPLVGKKSLATKDKGEAGGGARNGLGQERRIWR